MSDRTKPVTVLDLRDSPWVDGPGRTILDCACSLRDSRYRVLVAGLGGGSQNTNEYVVEARRRGLPGVLIEDRGGFDRGVMRQILGLIDREGVDVIHTHDFRTDLFGLLCARLRRKPIVSTVHGWIANDAKGRFYVKADQWLLRFFDRVIAVSDRTGALVRKAGVATRRLSVIPNALKVEDYRPDPRDQSYRDELGCGPETVLIANIGRLSPEKGQMPFLEAAVALRDRGHDLKFILIGIGPDRDALEAFVRANGLEDCVVFAGFRKDMTRIYNSLDLVVQSSYTEGMPNVMLEALLMAKPVIATDVGGTAEVVRDGVTGVTIPAGSAPVLSDAIGAYLRERGRFGEMAEAGRRDMLARFDHRVRVERLGGLYAEVAGGR